MNGCEAGSQRYNPKNAKYNHDCYGPVPYGAYADVGEEECGCCEDNEEDHFCHAIPVAMI